MKVIEDNYHKFEQHECLWCESILEIDLTEDVELNADCVKYFVCPLCHKRNYI